MKILIINPPGPGESFYLREGRCMHKTDVWTSVLPPISLVLTGTILKKSDFKVRVIDSAAEKLTFTKVEKIMKKERFDLVFINTGTPTIRTDLKVAEIAKFANPGSTTCAFGLHVSALPEESFKINPFLDIIIRGEPEFTAREIAMSLNNSKPFENIKGICLKKNGQIYSTPEREYIKNVDELPIPDWELVPYKNYILPLRFKPYFYVVTSRGCPYRCSFCAQHLYYGRDVRLRSPQKIINEIKFLINHYGITDFMFWADTFTINREHTVELCNRIISEKLNIYWTTTTRIDLVDEELLTLMKKAGCWLIVHGIESGSEDALYNMHKQITIPQIINTVKLEKKMGFKVIGHFIIGFPDETEENIRKTIHFARELPIDFAQFYFATPFPGSNLYEECKARNLLLSSDWSYYEQDKTVIKNSWIPQEKLYKLRREAYRKFYLRPRIIAQNLKYIIEPAGISYMINNGKTFLKFLFS